MSCASKWIVAVVVMTVTSLTALACVRPSNRLEGVTAVEPPPGPPVDQRVVINSRTLGNKLAFGDVVSRQQGLLLHVQVAVENVTKRPVAFEYRWEWTDATGFQLGDTLSAWQPAVVGANERKLMSGTGPGPAAANFRLYLREAGS